MRRNTVFGILPSTVHAFAVGLVGSGIALALVTATGCTILRSGSKSLSPPDIEFSKLLGLDSKTDAPKSLAQVANPPAKTIRFDGDEIVLGTLETSQVPLREFESELRRLISASKFYTASRYADHHRNVSERLLWRYWADSTLSATEQGTLRLLAQAQSRGLAKRASWTSMLELVESQPNATAAYRIARAEFASLLKSGDPEDASADAALQAAAQQLQHPLVTSDALQLLAVRELLAGHLAWSESLYRQAIEVSMSAGDSIRAANYSLLVAGAVTGGDIDEDAEATWTAAIEQHVAGQMARRVPVDISFWQAAVAQKPARANWPADVMEALAAEAESCGCSLSMDSPVELVLWSGIAQCQYERGDAQTALVNFKKAESFASGSDKLWLRIAQSRSLAAMGQVAAAAAVLSGPAASPRPDIAAAARAALGCSKIQAGAYQQGARLLNKAIHEDPSITWPAKLDAEADLALAMAILGDADTALNAMHKVQDVYERTGDLVSLLQSLDNELQILDLEGRTDAAAQVKLDVARLERS